MIKWEDLPCEMQNEHVKSYYDILKKKRISLLLKKLFDFSAAIILLIVLLPAMCVIAALIKSDSKGKIIFKQLRITQYSRSFYIYKFRTMVDNAHKTEDFLTVSNDVRITRIGAILRKYRLDELPQLINIIKGEMSFVGTRPEVSKYVDHYTDEMMATLLLPAGITSLASIVYKNEDEILSKASDVDEAYIDDILPAKMIYNLQYITNFRILYDFKLMAMTVFAVLGKKNHETTTKNANEAVYK